MNTVSFLIENCFAEAITLQPFYQGFPLPKGAIFHTSDLCLVDKLPSLHHVRFNELSRWSDGSLQWVNVQGTISLGSCEAIEVHVAIASKQNTKCPVREINRDIRSDTQLCLDLDGPETRLLPTIRRGARILDELVDAKLQFKDANSTDMKVEFASGWHHDPEQKQYTLIQKKGVASDPETGRKINIELRYQHLPHTGVMQLDIELHNPEAARHCAGVWDLGDHGSFGFNDCSLVITYNTEAFIHWQIDPTEDWHEIVEESVCIFQGGSGGPNSISDNHVNAKGKIPIEVPGYVVSANGENVLEGGRAKPVINIAGKNSNVSIQLFEFWQNFPKMFVVKDKSLRIGLFPEEFTDTFELQGGEKKTHSIFFNFTETQSPGSIAWLDRPLSILLAAEHYEYVDVLPVKTSVDRNPDFVALLGNALDESHGFEAKREKIDEYGWRNYGDLYADHETWGYAGDDLFVSHYNNQYDPIYGFARQYISTGDVRWFNLMCALAKHVIDIDIYHTDKDRAEYNGGLFWHTDHYVKAYTSTHRTYSAEQNSDTHEVVGGGPGGQHCYTNGLKYYFFLTGDKRGKDCVIQLENWVRGFYEGTSTLQEWCLRLLRREAGIFIGLIKGKQVHRFEYPLDRGVGNYLRALVDCYELTGNADYLKKAEYVIKNTVSPFDKIKERNFEDVESTWYYTIFFQSLIQYLNVKRTNHLFDENFYYARDTLQHYANWMCKNETPYMQNPDRLEYPNETWIAQDIRKAHVLIESYQYSDIKSEHMRERAKYFADYVISELSASEYQRYTRIICILLQNDGVREMIENPSCYCDKSTTVVKQIFENPNYTLLTHFSHLVKSLGKSLYHFSLRKEIAWFRLRVQN